MDLSSFRLTAYHWNVKINRLLGKSCGNDEFDWQYYSNHYQYELSQVQKDHTLILKKDDYIFSNGELLLNKDILPLHPNYRLIYETILQLSPQSVFELGCGGGDHLHNLSILNPNIKLHGVDISEKQIKLLHRRHKDLKADIRIFDITKPHPKNSPIVDVVFTQAVLMHLQTKNNHLKAIENLFNHSKNQVILMENWERHNFMQDIQKMHEKQLIKWKDIFFYYRVSKEFNKPHLMIISNNPLKYPILNNYEVLSRNVV